MSLRIIGVAAVAALVLASGWQGYRMGGQHCQAAHNAERHRWRWWSVCLYPVQIFIRGGD